MITILIISAIVIILVAVLSIITTNRAYSYKHTVDELPEHLQQYEAKQKEQEKL